MLGWVVLGKTPRSLLGSRGYNSVNYHLIYYGERGNLWHGECMRSTECLLVVYMCWIYIPTVPIYMIYYLGKPPSI